MMPFHVRHEEDIRHQSLCSLCGARIVHNEDFAGDFFQAFQDVVDSFHHGGGIKCFAALFAFPTGNFFDDDIAVFKLGEICCSGFFHCAGLAKQAFHFKYPPFVFCNRCSISLDRGSTPL